MPLKHIVLFLLMILSLSSFSQSYREHRGDIFNGRFNYNKAVEMYLQVMENEPENHFVMKKLAESYKQLSNDTASIVWYAKLIATNNYEPGDLYNYSVVLKNVGNYDKSGKMLALYADNKKEDRYLLDKNYVNEISKDTFQFKVTLVEASSPESDFSPAYFGDKIIFVSSRQGVGFLGREYERDGEAYLKLFVADTMPNGQLDSIRPFDNKFNTKFHEGPVSFCEADSTMYFTRNNYKVFKGLSSDGQVKLKIYQSKFTYSDWLFEVENFMDSIGINTNLNSDDWRRVKEFEHNSKEFSVGHPSLSKDGSIMYFTSDMEGGMGGTDIYRSARTGPNTWAEPQNLASLNTEGNEMFPFIHESGVLFFASDGWPGIGGLDIFKAIPNLSTFDKPHNMGAPLNSMEDDFGLIANEDTKNGYFTSNRPGGKGGDDLYHVVFNNEIKYILACSIKEKYTGMPIPEAIIKLSSDIETQDLKTNKQGMTFSTIDYTAMYNIKASQGLYMPHTSNFNPRDFEVINDTIHLAIELDYYGIYGSVFVKGSDEKVPEVEVMAVPVGETDTIKIISDTIGDFKMLLDGNTDYDLVFNKPDFFMLRENYSTIAKASGYENINEYISVEIEVIEVGKTIEIPNIYYDLGKWDIRDDAAAELENVVTFMIDNPTISIELGSHTDARGSSSSNQRLSQKRAESAVNWIVEHEISAERIVAKGYGETKIKNRCADGVKCSEKEHQENRRTEIQITSF